LILVTGSTGYIGSHLLSALAKNNINFRGTFREKSSLPNDSVEYFDIGEINSSTNWRHALSGIEIVVHLASRAHLPSKRSDQFLGEFREVNFYGSTNLAKQCVAMGVKKFIYISSIGVNGESTDGDQLFCPDDVPSPSNAYTKSKYEAECGLLEIGANTTMEIVIIRPPLVYGPNPPGNLESLIKLIKTGIPLPFLGIGNKRSFISVENLCDVILRCIYSNNLAGKVLLVSDGQDLSLSEFCQMLGCHLGISLRLFYVPKALLKFFFMIIGKGFMAIQLLESLRVNISETKKLLDWSPRAPFDNQSYD
jgi:nucleoside-diphosphate-sugar epimerase